MLGNQRSLLFLLRISFNWIILTFLSQTAVSATWLFCSAIPTLLVGNLYILLLLHANFLSIIDKGRWAKEFEVLKKSRCTYPELHCRKLAIRLSAEIRITLGMINNTPSLNLCSIFFFNIYTLYFYIKQYESAGG